MANRKTALRRASTVTDVARAANVSVATVSRVVNGHANVTPETRQRIQAVVKKLRYVPHSAARNLVMKRNHVVGVLLPDLYGMFFSELIRGIDAAARARHLQVLLSSSHGDSEEMSTAIRSMHGRVAGLIILAPQRDERGISALDSSTPTVFINSAVSFGRWPSLRLDSYGGARAMVKHLVARGFKAIAHISGPEDNFDARERQRGYHDELTASLGRDQRPIYVRGDFSEASGFDAAGALLANKRRPDAVFAANDMMAFGALAGFAKHGVEVPRDIAVVGFDDIPLARYVRPALTTMRVPIFELGNHAVEELVRVITDEPSRIGTAPSFLPELVIRESCGSPGELHEQTSEPPRARPRRPRKPAPVGPPKQGWKTG